MCDDPTPQQIEEWRRSVKECRKALFGEEQRVVLRPKAVPTSEKQLERMRVSEDSRWNRD